jgi:hypothetical protein
MNMRKALLLLFLVTLLGNGCESIGISTGICYAGCATLVVTCYSAAGLVFGTVTAGAGAPAAAIACNAAFGKCMAACTVATAVTP